MLFIILSLFTACGGTAERSDRFVAIATGDAMGVNGGQVWYLIRDSVTGQCFVNFYHGGAVTVPCE